MSIFSTFSPQVLTLVLLVSLSYILCVFAPVLYSAIVVLRRSPVLPRRFLFVGTVTALCYGGLGFIGFAFELPLTAYLVYIAPQLEASGHFSGGALTSIGALVSRYWWLMLGPVLLLVSVVTTRYLAKRWVRIVEALSG